MGTGAQQPELLTERDVLEGLTPDQLVDYIVGCGARVTEIERSMNLAGEVLDGYGISVTEVLDKRESENKNAET